MTQRADSSVSRRRFVKAACTASALASFGLRPLASSLYAAPSGTSAAETAVAEFYQSLSDVQKKKICFGFDHQLRSRINANWHVTEPEIGNDFYSDRQRTILDQVLKGLTSEDGYTLIRKQMDDDDGGFEAYSVAVFGEPGKGPFELEFTGRHLTLRADGNSVDKAAFGGPIVYGHGAEETSENLFYYQTQQANEVFKALDTDQRTKALVTSAPPKEAAVEIQGDAGQFPGISISDLKQDQQALVEKTLSVLLAPYRQEDRDEVMQIVRDSGGIEKLNMAFYQKNDLNHDHVWDIWRVEGPSFVWHFRGAPHVHAYINIAQRKV